jgi:VWFA-related protein
MNRSSRVLQWCLAVLLWAAPRVCLAADPPQSGPQQPASSPDITFKSQVNLVVVDVVVTGNNNQPAKGLSQQDFEILEDKKPQQVRSFEIHEEQPIASQTAKLAHNTFSNAVPSEPGTINIILLDQLHTQTADQEFGREELLKYLKQKPADVRCAIYVLGANGLQMLQGITADNVRLIAAVSSKAALPKLPAFGGPAFAVRNASLINDSSSPLMAMADIANSFQNVPGRKNLLWLSGEFEAAPVPREDDVMLPSKFTGWQTVNLSSENQVLHLASGRLTLGRIAVYPIDLTGLTTTITSTVAYNRTCWGYNGYSSPFPDMNNLGQATGSVYFPPYGTNNFFYSRDDNYDCGQHTFKEHGAGLDSVAAETGGQAFHNTNGIAQAITQAVSQGATYYTLSYAPSNRNFDGKVRNIKVVLNQKGYHLAYRTKYYADDPSTLIRSSTAANGTITLPGGIGPAGTAAVVAKVQSPVSQAQDPIFAAMQYGAPNQQGIIFTAELKAVGNPVVATPEQMQSLQQYEAFRYASIAKAVQSLNTKQDKKALRSKEGVKITTLPPIAPVRLQRYSIKYSVPATALNLIVAGDKQTAAIEIAILAYDDSGKRLNGAGEVVNLGLSTSNLEQSENSGYQARQTIDVPEQTAALRLAVRDVSSNKTGSLEVPMANLTSP